MFTKKLTVFLLVIGLIFGLTFINCQPIYAMNININQKVITKESNTTKEELTYPNHKNDNNLGLIPFLEGGLFLTGGIGLGWFLRHQSLLKSQNFNSLKERIENLEDIVTKN